MKVQDAIWFTTGNGECIGIVYGTDHIGTRKAYIGVGDGHDEGLDVQLIVDRGAKVFDTGLEKVLEYLKGN